MENKTPLSYLYCKLTKPLANIQRMNRSILIAFVLAVQVIPVNGWTNNSKCIRDCCGPSECRDTTVPADCRGIDQHCFSNSPLIPSTINEVSLKSIPFIDQAIIPESGSSLTTPYPKSNTGGEFSKNLPIAYQPPLLI
ncbi:MAG: hypothetical protein GXO90_10680 [FCB group bacterium]|nr:hypothetical protein [FCB group bacterium]